MDYTQASLRFKVLKAARYVRLYGPRRTIRKVEGQLHLRREYKIPPQMDLRKGGRHHVGIIGCGNFAFANLSYYVTRNYGDVIRGVADVNMNRAASLASRYRALYYDTDPERLLNDPLIDLVFISSNHASHADYAISALARGKHVHIEKPHVVTSEQLARLTEAMSCSTGRVNLGFNRPHSPIGRAIFAANERESGPGMYNWFIAGHALNPDHWYFDESEGGRVLGNLCHWTDFLLRLVPYEDRYPLRIIPTAAATSDCDIAVTYVFGDGSIAAVTFSAKGHTFEGVKERFAGHRGNLLVMMDDFRTLRLDVGADKRRIVHVFRNHGHEENVRRSYEMESDSQLECSVEYVRNTGLLFLETRRALASGNTLVLQSGGTTTAHT